MRKALFYTVIAVTCSVAVLAIVYYRLGGKDELTRQHILSQIRDRWPSLNVELESATWDESRLRLNSLQVKEEIGSEWIQTIDIPRVILDVDIQDNRTRVRYAEIQRPHIRAIQKNDGHWNIETWIPQSFSGLLDRLAVRNATVEIYDKPTAEEHDSEEKSSNINRQIPFSVLNRSSFTLEKVSKNTLVIHSEFHSERIHRADIAVNISTEDKTWKVEGQIDRLQCDPELMDFGYRVLSEVNPQWASSWMAQSAELATANETSQSQESIKGNGTVFHHDRIKLPWSIEGEAGIRFVVQSGQEAGILNYDVLAKLDKGTIQGDALPFSIHQVSALARCREGNLEILDFKGRNGTTVFTTRGNVSLLLSQLEEKPVDAVLHIQAEDLVLDERIRQTLPSNWERWWKQFQPGGRVNVDVDLLQKSKGWELVGSVECVDASFLFQKFPYRVEHVQGMIHRQPDKMMLDLMGEGGQASVRVQAEVRDPGQGAPFDLHIQADNVRLDDDKLLTALPVMIRKNMESFHIQGRADVQWRVLRASRLAKVEQSGEIHLDRCSVRSEYFPYPLDNVTGTIIAERGKWEFRNISGLNDRGSVHATAFVTVSPQGSLVDLELSGVNVNLEPELRDAFTADYQKIWNELGVSGRCDFSLQMLGSPGKMHLRRLHVKPKGMKLLVKHFPYPLTFVKGDIECEGFYQPPVSGVKKEPKVSPIIVRLRQLEAEHQESRWRGNGQMEINEDGVGYLQLHRLVVTKLVFGDVLMRSLPQSARKVFEHIHPGTQPVTLVAYSNAQTNQPALRIKWNRRLGEISKTEWNVSMFCGGTNLQVAEGITDLRGHVQITGQYENGELSGSGELDLDTFTWQGMHFRNVSGPIRMNASKVIFGNWDQFGGVSDSLSKLGSKKGHVTGSFMGGRMLGDMEISLRFPWTVRLRAQLADGKIEKYAQEYLPKATRLRGRFSAAFAVQSSSNHSRPVGWGHLSAEQADLYELPALLELLRLAWSIPTLDIPESTVFHRGSVSFQFHPEGLRLRPILLVSDAVTLQGHGDMDTLSADSPMKIKLYLLAGGGQRPIPLLSDIVSQASKQLMEFEVLGSLNKPTVKQNYIPAVESTLEEIGSLGNTGASQAVQVLKRFRSFFGPKSSEPKRDPVKRTPNPSGRGSRARREGGRVPIRQ